MELLYNELCDMALLAGIEPSRIAEILGEEVRNLEVDPSEDLSWRTFDAPLSTDSMAVLSGETKALVKKITRRKSEQTYHLFCDATCNNITLLGTSKDHTIRVESFKQLEDFTKHFLSQYKNLNSLGLSHPNLEHLSKDGIRVVALLIELFIEKYPEPNYNWEPDEMLVFTNTSLSLIQEDSRHRKGPNTWWAHFKELLGLEDLGQEEMESGIYELLIQEHIGYLDEVEGQEVYYVGEDFTWFIRGLAWWDRGLLLEEQNSQFLFFANSSPYVMIAQEGVDFSLFNVSGKEAASILGKYCQFTFQEEPKAEAIDVEEKPVINFCGNCGYRLERVVNFCPACGHKIL